MKYTAGPYQSGSDLYQIGKLIRRAHACNRLCPMDCPRVKVESWSESAGANRLYSACGLMEYDHWYSWKKDSST